MRSWQSPSTLLVVATIALTFASSGSLRSHASPAAPEPRPTSRPDFILGTWTGTSTCVGNRPACKNETLVYRFVRIDGQPGRVRQLADKVLDGKRVPMGALVFQVDEPSKSVRSEFTRGRSHGIWSYSLKADELTGTLVIRPDHSPGREVKAHRANESSVPEAPPLSAYDE